MATTAVSTATTNVTTALGAGSGIDIKSLAQSLVDAEKAPRQAAIDKGISKNEKVVSGLAAVKYALTTLQTAFDDLKDKSDFKSIAVSNSQPSAFTATASASADASSNTLLVSALAAALNLSNNTSGAKTKVAALVTAYNNAMSMLDELTNPKSTLETYGASLVGNSTVSNIRSQLRALVTADSSTSASSGGLTALRDIGIEVDKAGKLASNALKLDLALDLNFTNTVTLLSGNQENQSSFDTALRGLAGDASKTIIGLVSSSGTIATESTNATTRITKYKDDLVKLEARMTQVLARYSKQFATMDSMVGQTKSTQTGLTSSFAGLMAMYTNK